MVYLSDIAVLFIGFNMFFKLIFYFLLVFSVNRTEAMDRIANISDYEAARGRILFSLGYFKSVFALGGISYLLLRLIERYGIKKLKEICMNNLSLKKYLPWLHYLQYFKYLVFLPALIDLKKKASGVSDLYQSPQTFSPRVRDFTHSNTFSGIVNNTHSEMPFKKDSHLLLFGAYKFDNVFPNNILALYSSNYMRSLPANYDGNPVRIIEGRYTYLDWGNYVCPVMRARSIEKSAPLLKEKLLINEFLNNANSPFYLVGESYGGIVGINTLYHLCNNEADYKDIKEMHIMIITNSSPYEKSDIEKLQFIMEKMSHVKIVGLIKFDDAIPNSDPFPDKAVNTFLIKRFYDECVRKNDPLAKRIFIAALWHKVNQEKKTDQTKEVITAVEHNEDPGATYLAVQEFIEKYFMNNTTVLPVEHFIVPKE